MSGGRVRRGTAAAHVPTGCVRAAGRAADSTLGEQ